MKLMDLIFDDKRLAIGIVTVWMVVVSMSLVSLNVMASEFMTFGPSNHTKFMTVHINTWQKWGVLTAATFCNTAVADFMSDAIVPWIQNTVQDHKTKYLPYRKFTCYMIQQLWAVYVSVMRIFDVSLMLSQIDFLIVRLAADLAVNTFTAYKFMRHKVVDRDKYNMWSEDRLHIVQAMVVDGEICDLQKEAVQPLTSYKHAQ